MARRINHIVKGNEVLIKKGIENVDERFVFSFGQDVKGEVWEVKGGYAVVSVSCLPFFLTYYLDDLVRVS